MFKAMFADDPKIEAAFKEFEQRLAESLTFAASHSLTSLEMEVQQGLRIASIEKLLIDLLKAIS